MPFNPFGNKTTRQKSPSLWKEISSLEALDQVIQASLERPQLIFKHSTRCGISRIVLRQFESAWDLEDSRDLYLLDLIKYREISDGIEQMTGVIHQSPQVLVIHKGVVLEHASHQSISAELFRSKMKM